MVGSLFLAQFNIYVEYDYDNQKSAMSLQPSHDYKMSATQIVDTTDLDYTKNSDSCFLNMPQYSQVINVTVSEQMQVTVKANLGFQGY